MSVPLCPNMRRSVPIQRWQIEMAALDAAADAEREREIDDARDDWDRERGLLTDEDD